MAEIREKILYSKDVYDGASEEEMGQRFITRMLGMANKELKEHGDRDWLFDCLEKSSIRISEMEGKSRRVASGLSRLGLGPGDILQTAYNTQLDFYWPVMGSWLCGAGVSVADPDMSVDTVKAQILDTKCKIVVVAQEALETYLAANIQLGRDSPIKHILVIDRDPSQSLPDGCSSFKTLYNDDGSQCPEQLPVYDPEEVALIHWTSGTTGRPKGVQKTQRYLNMLMRKSKLPARTISLQSNTFFHMGAFILPFDGGIMNQFTCYFVKDTEFTAERLIQAVNDYKPAFYMAGPYHVQAVSCMEANGLDLSSLFCIMPAGGQMTKGAVKKLHVLFPALKIVFHFFGTTESGQISWTFDNSNMCLGALVPGAKAYVRDLATGERLGPGQEGEICVHTTTLMKGYLNNPEADKEFFDEEGFARLGDMGHYDEEGKLFFKERIKEIYKVKFIFTENLINLSVRSQLNFLPIFKVKAKWFGPTEVEEVIEQIDGVLEACVWGSYNASVGDEIIHAAVVIKKNSNITKDTVKDHVQNKLEAHKQLTGDIIFLNSIPHNPQGKKLRRLLKTQHSEKKSIGF